MSMNDDEKRAVHTRYLFRHAEGRTGELTDIPIPENGFGSDSPAAYIHHIAIVDALGVCHGAQNIDPVDFDSLMAIVGPLLIPAQTWDPLQSKFI